MLDPVKVGIVGLGTVGGGTFNVLTRNQAAISGRAGRMIEVVHVGTRRGNPACDLANTRVSEDIFAVVNDPDVQVLVELIGGTTTAKEVVLQAIDNGKSVVTANKALIAIHGNEIFEKAAEKGVTVAFEAAVAGGIPIIKAIREGLAGNRIQWLAGIINGTGNFILSEMRSHGRDFADVLAEAQALGYAEADPTFDVEGIDAAHKLAILGSLSFGIPLQFERVYTEGISDITQEDVQYAAALGYEIKHLGIAKRVEQGVEMRVHPTLVPTQKILASVNGVMNAVSVSADAVGQTLYYGAGAGAEPTASAVVADIVDVARSLSVDPDHRVPPLAFHPNALEATTVLPMDDVVTGYYLRFNAEDCPGVLADVTRILTEHAINIEAVLQQEAKTPDTVPVVILTQPVQERAMNDALKQIEALTTIAGSVVRIRLERFDT